MRSSYPIYNNHLDLAHFWWKQILKHGDIAIDATCGNGNDTLLLAQQILTPTAGWLWGFDIQASALDKTRQKLEEQLDSQRLARIHLIQGSHDQLPEALQPASVKLVVYNLGYLPGGDKAITTMTDTTLRSLEKMLVLVQPGGLISITCYPGHAEGLAEQNAVVDWAATLARDEWNTCYHRWVNAPTSPSLLLLQKKL